MSISWGGGPKQRRFYRQGSWKFNISSPDPNGYRGGIGRDDCAEFFGYTPGRGRRAHEEAGWGEQVNLGAAHRDGARRWI